MSFRLYESYRESGVRWLGSVPSGWTVKAIKHCFSVVGGSTPKSEVEEFWDGEHVWVTPADLSGLSGFGIVDSARRITDAGLESCGTNLVPPGSIVLSTRAPIGSLAIAGTSLCTNQGCKSLVPKQGVVPRYFAYVLSIAGEELNLRGRGTTFLELSADALGAFEVVVPTAMEQVAIAAFLDRETAKIDALVEEQKRLIELLKEKRQAVISQAVTKGLDPSVPMKDSGVAWLGEVPAHWEVTALKRLCEKITDGAHISPDTVDGAFPFVSTKDVQDGSIDLEGCLRTSAPSYDLMVRTGCRPCAGDVLFSKDGTIGRTAVVPPDSEFVVASSLIIIRPKANELRSEYLDIMCQSSLVVSQVEAFVKGAGLPRLSIQNLLKVIGVFPPVEEQDRVLSHVLSEMRRLDSLVTESDDAMLLLAQRRSALISAAVTGKIDVRGLAPH